MTVLKTNKAVINGKSVIVKTIYTNKSNQDIRYQINDGKLINYNEFWKMKPKIAS
jgi:hypothetical protein